MGERETVNNSVKDSLNNSVKDLPPAAAAAATAAAGQVWWWRVQFSPQKLISAGFSIFHVHRRFSHLKVLRSLDLLFPPLGHKGASVL